MDAEGVPEAADAVVDAADAAAVAMVDGADTAGTVVAAADGTSHGSSRIRTDKTKRGYGQNVALFSMIIGSGWSLESSVPSGESLSLWNSRCA